MKCSGWMSDLRNDILLYILYTSIMKRKQIGVNDTVVGVCRINNEFMYLTRSGQVFTTQLVLDLKETCTAMFFDSKEN